METEQQENHIQEVVETTTPEEPPPKKKRVLTEAQRLAFMKGREKRMMNLERKRQEKLEAIQEEEAVTEKETAPLIPTLKRQTNQIDESGSITELLKDIRDRLTPAAIAKPKRKYTRREKEPTEEIEEETQEVEEVIPPQKNFVWM